MKTYLLTTCIVFGLITLAHFARIAVENRHLATDPVFMGLTVASAGLSFWSWRLYRRMPPGTGKP